MMGKSGGAGKLIGTTRRLLVCCLPLAILVALVMQAPAPVSSEPSVAEQTVYVVAWGDTLSSIALRYGTSASAIAQANQLTNPNLIFVGQRLVIPGGSSSAPSGNGVYTVQRGDTLSAIAAQFHTTIQQLVGMNGLINPNLIYVGQRLAVPGSAPTQPTSAPGGQRTTYRVQRGDTLIGIATRFHVNMWDIVLANNIANPSLIYVGQTLLIPGAQPVSGATPTPARTSTPAPTKTGATATPKPATPTPRPATATPGSSFAFSYVQGSMRVFPNCGTVYFKGKVLGVGGEPVNGKTVRLRFAGNVAFKVSGDGDAAGVWGFSPLAPAHYHTPFTFLIDIVESQANPVPQSDTVEVQFTDCDTAGQFENIVFQYGRSNPTPTPGSTSVPTQTPRPTSVPEIPSVEWDPRLDQLPCVQLTTVQQQGVRLQPADRYWRLVSARWLNEEESRKDIQIYVDLLDEAGQRVFGQAVIFENGGSYRVISEKQSCCYPWDYPVKWPMFNTLCSYSAHVEGLPSDKVSGMGLGTPEHPDWTIHTGFVLTFQRTEYR